MILTNFKGYLPHFPLIVYNIIYNIAACCALISNLVHVI